MKGTSRLFRDIPDDIWEMVMLRLQEARQEFPSYRDDELLMYLLCREIQVWKRKKR